MHYFFFSGDLPPMGGTATDLYMELLRRGAGPRHEIVIVVARLAADMHRSSSTIFRALKRLQETGYVERWREEGRTYVRVLDTRSQP